MRKSSVRALLLTIFLAVVGASALAGCADDNDTGYDSNYDTYDSVVDK
jgi:hypothetical protein